jgi:hypothetical protein
VIGHQHLKDRKDGANVAPVSYAAPALPKRNLWLYLF